VDFERVTSLDGTFIANKYETRDTMKNNIIEKRRNKVLDALEWNEEDMVSYERQKESQSRMYSNSNINAKQVATQGDIFDDVGIPIKDIEQHVKSYITHNKGGKWELIRAPEKIMNGTPTNCYMEDGCSLHLEIYSHMGQLSPVYSTEKAVGIVLATGNMGKRLTENGQMKHLFLSRDGGLNWKGLRRGTHIYEIGDHGAIIVIAKKREPTNYIEFSWDEGETWEKMVISERDLLIENIIIEPNSVSQQFMVYGNYADDSGDDYEPMTSALNQAFLVYLDFSSLHEPQCKGIDNAGTPDSDYELWTPHDGRFGENQCFLGMHKTFVRRKQSSMCYNGEEHEMVTHVEPCTCADIDFECDIGYIRNEDMNG